MTQTQGIYTRDDAANLLAAQIDRQSAEIALAKRLLRELLEAGNPDVFTRPADKRELRKRCEAFLEVNKPTI